MLDWTYKMIRRFVISVIAMTLLLVGIALLALPGPGVLFIVASLAVLAIEFVWARTLLNRLKAALPGQDSGSSEDGAIAGLRRRIRAAFRRLRGRPAKPDVDASAPSGSPGSGT